MKTVRRFAIATALLALVCGTATAESTFSVSSLVTFTTDGSYTLTLSKFDPTICGVQGCTLDGATLYFFGSDDVTHLTLTNSASSAQQFDLEDTSALNQGSDNSVNSADKFSGEVLDLFDTGIGPGHAAFPTVSGPITLGPAGSGPCPEYTPSSACNSVAYTPGDVVANNTDAVYGFITGVGIGGVDGVMQTLSSADANTNYVGAGDTFTLTGATKNLTTFSGGGGNINLGINTRASFQAEIDYNYTVNNTPEPATMILMGGALLGLGLFSKRMRKSQ